MKKIGIIRYGTARQVIDKSFQLKMLINIPTDLICIRCCSKP